MKTKKVNTANDDKIYQIPADPPAGNHGPGGPHQPPGSVAPPNWGPGMMGAAEGQPGSGLHLLNIKIDQAIHANNYKYGALSAQVSELKEAIRGVKVDQKAQEERITKQEALNHQHGEGIQFLAEKTGSDAGEVDGKLKNLESKGLREVKRMDQEAVDLAFHWAKVDGRMYTLEDDVSKMKEVTTRVEARESAMIKYRAPKCPAERKIINRIIHGEQVQVELQTSFNQQTSFMKEQLGFLNQKMTALYIMVPMYAIISAIYNAM